MHSNLISLIVALAALACHRAAAMDAEDIAECVAQVSDALRAEQIPPVIEQILERNFPPNGTEHDYARDVEADGIDEDSCVQHLERYVNATDPIRCHLDLAWSDDHMDAYIDALLHDADPHTTFFFLGSSMCRSYLYGSDDDADDQFF